MWSKYCSLEKYCSTSLSHPLFTSPLLPSRCDHQPPDPRTAGLFGRLAMQSPLTTIGGAYCDAYGCSWMIHGSWGAGVPERYFLEGVENFGDSLAVWGDRYHGVISATGAALGILSGWVCAVSRPSSFLVNECGCDLSRGLNIEKCSQPLWCLFVPERPWANESGSRRCRLFLCPQSVCVVGHSCDLVSPPGGFAMLSHLNVAFVPGFTLFSTIW